MAAVQAAENHKCERGLTWYSRWGIYISIPNWTQPKNSAWAAEAPSLKISTNGTSLKLSGRLSNHHKNSWAVRWKGISQCWETAVKQKLVLKERIRVKATARDPS